MHEPHNQISSIYWTRIRSNVLRFGLGIIYTGINWVSVFVLCRRGATSSSPQKLQRRFSHFCSCWTNDELTTSSVFSLTRLCSTHSLLSRLVGKRTRPHCLTTPGQRNVCVPVFSVAWLCLSVFGLKYEVVDCTSSLTLWEALLHLIDYDVCVDNCKASWVEKRFRSSGSPMKGTSRWVKIFPISFQTLVLFVLLW